MDAGRVLDWRAAFGVSDPSLSDAGRLTARRAADDLAAFLGPTWLWRAAQRPAAERPELAVLSGSSDAVAVLLDAVSLWARLRLLVEHGVQGIAKLRGNLARNPGRDEFRHGATQARLAAQALLAGARPVLEPPVGDVLVQSGSMDLRAELLLELRGLNRAGPGTTRRLVRAVELKAKQTRSAPAAWVWIEDGGALWSLPGFGDRPARERIDLVAEALDRVFATWPHLCGVVLATTPSPPAPAASSPSPVAVAVTERHDRGAALLRVLPDGRTRDTVVVHRPALDAAQFGLVHRLCADEPAWLDAALARLGLPGGVAALLDQNSGVNTRASSCATRSSLSGIAQQ
ncbi:hypothetical protein [Dactylosporangium sp. NPDC048998]|uniref:hypothetical protein n=1 Tax=Dactylosporangium sp. NPDC048998 TaxID=3363976 RepID=UPI003719A307